MRGKGERRMTRHNALLHCFGLGIVLYFLVSILAIPAALAAIAPAESLDSLHEKAKKEGKVTIYAALSSRFMEVILPAFMKRFPGVTIDHIDATADQLLARIVSEVRGGRLYALVPARCDARSSVYNNGPD
jgi:ABC-type glycerol-3-phosphate transport system substrate-binding protein